MQRPVVGTVAGALLLVAAGGAAPVGLPARAAQVGEQVVVLTIHHSRFSANHFDFAPGSTVRFVVRNEDPIAHELIVGDAAVQLRHERGTEAHHGDRPGEVSVAPGADAMTTYTFDAPGRLLFGCHLPGHWAYGMHGTIEVA